MSEGRPSPLDDDSIDQRVAADLEELRQSIREGEAEVGEWEPEHIAGVRDVLQQVNRAAGCFDAEKRSTDTSVGNERDADGVNTTTDIDWISQSHIGPYRINKVIARGGMGIVFHAHDQELNRTVALKMMIAGPFADEADRARFRGEAEAAARLDHPGIVPVYDVGQHRGQLYFTMGFVDGQNLATRIINGPLPPREAAELARQVAMAVAYAHQKEIVHRDLKPANVLVDGQGQAKITDFGLARRFDSDSDLTKTGQVLGTPGYMAPEQAAGNVALVGPASDVYSIGATLYAMLTGRPPFQAASSVDTLRLVLGEEPVSPRQLVPTIPIDLATICLKCLQKRRADRYPSASELGQDLERFLLGETVHARMPPRATRVYRWCRRRPLAAALITLVFMLAVVGPLMAIEQARLLRAEESAREEGRRILYISDMNLALSDWDQANVERCSELLRRHLPMEGETDLRGFEWYYLWRLWKQTSQAPVVFHDERLESMELSPDQRWMAVGGFDGGLSLVDLMDDNRVRHWNAHPYRTYALDVSPDGKCLASASVDDEVALWELPSGKLIRKLPGAHAITFSPVGWTFAYRTDSHSIAILDSHEADPDIIPDAHGFFIGDLAFSPDGKTLASAGWDNRTRLWDLKTKTLLREMPQESSVWKVAWSPDGDKIATGDSRGNVTLFSASDGTILHSTTLHDDTVFALAFSPDSMQLASAGNDNTIKLISSSTGHSIRSLRGNFAPTKSLVFAEEGRELWSASIDGNVKRWALDDPIGNDVLEFGSVVNGTTFSADGSRVAAIGTSGEIRIWETATGKLLRTMLAHKGSGWCIGWIGQGEQERIISVGEDRTVKVWGGPEYTSLLNSIPCYGRSNSYIPMAIDAEKRVVAFPDDRFSVKVWDIDSDTAHCQLNVGTAGGMCFMPGGRLAVASSELMFVCDWGAGTVAEQVKGDSRRVAGLSVSPDGTQLVSASYDRTVRLWHPNYHSDPALTLARVFKGHTAPVTDVCYSPDGRSLASVGEEHIVRLWDVQRGQQLAAFHGHTADVTDVVFSPDGQTLATSSNDGTVRLWRAPRN